MVGYITEAAGSHLATKREEESVCVSNMEKSGGGKDTETERYRDTRDREMLV